MSGLTVEIEFIQSNIKLQFNTLISSQKKTERSKPQSNVIIRYSAYIGQSMKYLTFHNQRCFGRLVFQNCIQTTSVTI